MVANPEMAAVAVMRSSFTSVRPVSESDAGDGMGVSTNLGNRRPIHRHSHILQRQSLALRSGSQSRTLRVWMPADR